MAFDNGTVVIGDDAKIVSASGDGVTAGTIIKDKDTAPGFIEIGDRADITGDRIGVYSYTGSEITIGDDAKITGTSYYGVYSLKKESKVVLGSKSEITGGTSGVYSDGGSEITIGDDAKITGTTNTGVYSHDGSKVTLGSNSEITGGYYGVYSYKGSEITLGSNSEISGAVYGVYSDLGSEVTLKSKSEITGGYRGVYSFNGSEITIGDEAKITGTSQYGVLSSTGSTVILGNKSEIAGAEVGVWSHKGSKITIGNEAKITGDYGVYGTTGSEVTIGDSAFIQGVSNAVTLDGDGTFGSIGENAKISSTGGGNGVEVYNDATAEVGAGASIQVNGDKSAAVAIFDGGSAKLHGGTMTNAATDSATLYAEGNDSKIDGQEGIYNIQGNIFSVDSATLSLDMEKNSYIKGRSGVESGGIINMDMLGSHWDMTGSSSLTNLTSNKSVVDMTKDGGAFNSLTTENLKGNDGYFVLDIDATTYENNSDRIYVNDTFSGTQAIDLNEITGLYVGTEAENTVLASVYKNEGTFTAVDGEGTLYYQRYELDKKENTDDNSIYTTDWYLKAVTNVDPGEKPTPGVDGSVSTGALMYYTLLDHDQLMKRLGDLRHKGEDEKGIWVRVKGAKIGRNGTFGFTNKYTHYELGYDEVMKEKPNYTRYGGVSISYAGGDATYSRGNGDNHSRAMNFYVTEMGNKGHYLDVVLRFHHMDSNFKMFDEKGRKIRGDVHNVGVSLSGEYGRKKMMDDNGWYIEPQGQLTLGYLGGDNYTTSNGIAVDQGGIRSALGRIGFNLGKDVDEKTNIYIKANLLHEFGGGYHATMTDNQGKRVDIDRSYQDTWFEYGIGAAIRTGKNNHIYFDFERSAGGDFKKDWSWNVGARWTY